MTPIDEQLIKDYFIGHVATVEADNGDSMIVKWAKPGDSHALCIFIIRKGALYVSGDLGAAVYEWSGRVSLAWIANTSLDYFEGKCQASETGRDFKQWSKEKAQRRALDLMKTQRDYEGDEYAPGVDEDEVRGACESNDDWSRFLSDNGDAAFGCDYWENYGIGYEIHIRCRLHHLGVKLAAEFLAKQLAELEPAPVPGG